MAALTMEPLGIIAAAAGVDIAAAGGHHTWAVLGLSNMMPQNDNTGVQEQATTAWQCTAAGACAA